MENQDETLAKLKNLVRENLQVDLSLELSSKSIKTRGNLQHLSFLKPREKSVKILLESLLSHSFQAELKCPQSGIIFLKIFCDIPIEESIYRVPKNRSQVLEILKNKKYSSTVLSLLEEALNLSSLSTKIVLKKSSTTKAYVELSEGHSFNVNSLLRGQNQDVSLAKVACIDGYIENVSEIHHLLNFLSETHTACLIVARGMSNDVLNTLKVNTDRKTLSIFPYVSPFDVENVNTLVDIAVASGTDVISSTKGNLISSLKIEELGELRGCIFSNSSIRSKANLRNKSLSIHIGNLRKTSEERTDISHLVTQRIRSLSSACIDISIPDDINFYSCSGQIDEGIRIISSIMNNTYDPYATSRVFLESFKKTYQNTSLLLL